MLCVNCVLYLLIHTKQIRRKSLTSHFLYRTLRFLQAQVTYLKRLSEGKSRLYKISFPFPIRNSQNSKRKEEETRSCSSTHAMQYEIKETKSTNTKLSKHVSTIYAASVTNSFRTFSMTISSQMQYSSTAILVLLASQE